MIFLLLIMFNSFLQKTKKLIENKTLDNETISCQIDRPKQNQNNVYNSRNDDVPLKELVYAYTNLNDVFFQTLSKQSKIRRNPLLWKDLEVVHEEDIYVTEMPTRSQLIRIEFTPTVPHCSLATLIGLCIRVKLQRNLTERYKLDIYVKKGTHSTEDEINKQVNDKERVAAAMENPNLLKIVENCIEEQE